MAWATQRNGPSSDTNTAVLCLRREMGQHRGLSFHCALAVTRATDMIMCASLRNILIYFNQMEKMVTHLDILHPHKLEVKALH